MREIFPVCCAGADEQNASSIALRRDGHFFLHVFDHFLHSTLAPSHLITLSAR